MPQNTQQLPSELNRDVEMIEEVKHISKNSSEACIPQNRNSCAADKVEIIPGTSNSKSTGSTLPGSSHLKEQTRILTFHVHYKNKIFRIDISDTKTVGMLIIMNRCVYLY